METISNPLVGDSNPVFLFSLEPDVILIYGNAIISIPENIEAVASMIQFFWNLEQGILNNVHGVVGMRVLQGEKIIEVYTPVLHIWESIVKMFTKYFYIIQIL